ncbi:transmembrane protein 272-like isoform X1 [Scomber scombrus]|uniref:Transmembrane protein 272-like isoform X1 n=1 Tax=Scomber scombrus TaxID=13677 RepID=A0AAV1N0I8_SCOSC
MPSCPEHILVLPHCTKTFFFLFEQDVHPIRRTNRIVLSDLIMATCDRCKCTADNVILGCIGSVILSVSLAQAIIGLIHINDCPRQPFIPFYMCGFLVIFLLTCFCVLCDMSQKWKIACCGVTAVIYLGWLIAGSITIYAIDKPDYEPESESFSCHEILYSIRIFIITNTGSHIMPLISRGHLLQVEVSVTDMMGPELDIHPIRRIRFNLSKIIMPESDNKYLGLGLLIFIFFFAHLGVGLVHINDCPRQPFIPIYLCGFGALFLLMLFCLAAYSNMSNKCNMGCFWGTIAVFFCWFFAGSITIYSIFEPNYEKTRHPDSYCNKILYLFAFWSTNLINGVTFSYLSYYCCSITIYFIYEPIYGITTKADSSCENILYAYAFRSTVFIYILLVFKTKTHPALAKTLVQGYKKLDFTFTYTSYFTIEDKEDVRPIRRTNRFNLSEITMPESDRPLLTGSVLPVIGLCIVAVMLSVSLPQMIIGSITIYSIYDPSNGKTTKSDSYCDRMLYMFAFKSTYVMYVLFGVGILSFLSYYCFKPQKHKAQITAVCTSSGPSEVSSHEGKDKSRSCLKISKPRTNLSQVSSLRVKSQVFKTKTHPALAQTLL